MGVRDDFYPRSPCGERRSWRGLPCSPGHFYPRSPCGERHSAASASVMGRIFLSTLSLRRATVYGRSVRKRTEISIHALLAESDRTRTRPPPRPRHFYPRSPCGERQFCSLSPCRIRPLFLSTLSLRRATLDNRVALVPHQHFYPRSPCGERRLTYRRTRHFQDISIHALLAESDLKVF